MKNVDVGNYKSYGIELHELKALADVVCADYTDGQYYIIKFYAMGFHRMDRSGIKGQTWEQLTREETEHYLRIAIHYVTQVDITIMNCFWS